MNRFFALVLLAFGFTSAAHAAYIPATWVDVATDATQHINSWDSYTYVHDLSDTGFNLQAGDKVDSFALTVSLADYNGGREQTLITAGGLFGGGSTGVFNLASGSLLSLLGRWELNTFGTLTVTVASLGGDFDLVGSTLTAVGRTTNVPEPGALGLLGVGLVGIALSKRRRKQAAKAA